MSRLEQNAVPPSPVLVLPRGDDREGSVPLWERWLQGVPDPVLAIGPSGDVRCANEAARQYPGRFQRSPASPEEWWYSVLWAPSARGVRDWALEVGAGEVSQSRLGMEVLLEGDGQPDRLTWDCIAFPGDGGQVWLLVRDRTHERQVIEMLARERDFSRRVLEAAGALVVVVDRELRIVQFNRACERLTGYKAEEVVGRSLPELLLPPEELSGVLQVIEELQTGNFPNQHENDWVTRSGERRRIAWTNNVIQGEDGQVRFLVGTGIDVTEQRREEERLRHQVLHDPLTGLANRNLLEELLRLSLHRAERDPRFLYGVLFLDLDGFKEVNDRHGHLVGDRVLQQVAERLRRSVRQTDTVARFGGDEFVVLAEPIAREEDLPALASRLVRAIREPFEVAGLSVLIGASIGVVAGSRGETSPADLLARADRAMYQAKRSGKSQSAFLRRPAAPDL